MRHPQQDILEASPEALARWLESQGEPAYRLSQLLKCLYMEHLASFSSMTTLPLALRARLGEAFSFLSPREVARLVSDDRKSAKFAFELEDGEEIESVWMRDGDHATFCISSQAGCVLKCGFCATGGAGFSRNLALKEMLGQVRALARAKGWPANIVFMGMGEPLLNLDAVLPALEALTDPQRFALGSRRITVSTAGVTPGIRELAGSVARPNLALSLNSPFDGQRSQLMPINKRYPLSGVLEACADYAERTGRRILLEYVLLGGVNTSAETARAVAQIACGLHAMVNLIEFNPVPDCGFHPPVRKEVSQFRAALENEGVKVSQRFRRGRDISAACGQLRGKHRHAARVAVHCPSPPAQDREQVQEHE